MLIYCTRKRLLRGGIVTGLFQMPPNAMPCLVDSCKSSLYAPKQCMQEKKTQQVEQAETQYAPKTYSIICPFSLSSLIHVAGHSLSEFVTADHDRTCWRNFQTTSSPSLEKAGRALFAVDVG